MRRIVPCLFVALLGMTVLALVGCPRTSETPETEGPAPIADTGAPAVTGPGEVEEGPAETALTKDKVKGFMASMEDETIEQVMDEIGEEMDVEGEEDPEVIREAFDAAAANEKLDEAVKAHGFSGAEEWVGTAKKVFPGLAYAMAVAMAEFVGIEEDSDEFKEMVEGSEFAEMEEVFDKPTEEEQQIIVDAVKELMAEEEAGEEPG